MVAVLACAGAFVFWRVQVALDNGLAHDLGTHATDLRQAALQLPPGAALRSLRDEGRESQLLAADGSLLASGAGLPAERPLLTPAEARRAARSRLAARRGSLLS